MSHSPRRWKIITLSENTKYHGLTGLICIRRTRHLKQFPLDCTYWFNNDLRCWYIQAPDEKLANICYNLFLQREKECIDYIKNDYIKNAKHHNMDITYSKSNHQMTVTLNKSNISSINPTTNNDVLESKDPMQIDKMQIDKIQIDKNIPHLENNNLTYNKYSLKSRIRKENIMKCIGKYITPLITHLQNTQHGTLTIDDESHNYLFIVEKHMQNGIIQYIMTVESLYFAAEFLNNFMELIKNIKINTGQSMKTYTYTSSLNNHILLPGKISTRMDNLNYNMIHLRLGYISYNNNTYTFATYPDLNAYIHQYIKNMELEYSYKQSLNFSYSVTSQYSFQYKTTNDDIQQRMERLSSILNEPPSEKHSDDEAGKLLPIFDIKHMIKTNNPVPSYPPPNFGTDNSSKRLDSDNSAKNTTKRQKIGIDHNADFIPLEL